jgi:hypothetical protein
MAEQPNGGGTLWIAIVAALVSLLLIGLLVWFLIAWRRRSDNLVPAQAQDVPEPSVTFTEDLTGEMECENPLASDEDGFDGSGNDIELSPDPDEMT